MDKENFNYQHENNFSTISNEDIQDISSFTESSMPTSLFPSSNNVYNSPNNNYNYWNQNASHNFNGNVNRTQDFPSGNQLSDEEMRNYIDHLTTYFFKHNKEAFEHLNQTVAKCKNGEFNDKSTPSLFYETHIFAKLDFPGVIYQLIPNNLNQIGGIIFITDEIYQKLFDFQIDDYPGPLSVERTTKEQISYYLKDQMSIELQDTAPIDWDSGHLLVSYLELLIKDNGKPGISDIVRLLNEGIETRTANFKKDNKRFYDSLSRNSFSRASSRAVSRASSRPVSPENTELSDPDLPQNSLEFQKGPGSVVSVMRRAVTTLSNDQKLWLNMNKFREYILSGRFDEAVDFAMNAGIWDHAFALALRMNNTSLVNKILTRFLRHAIHSNDPLYTMHELMASRQPRIVANDRGFSNSEYGDWRCHLSMILATKKFRPEESRIAIEAMGEKLILLRSYFAAHLCFLLADTPFGLDKTALKYRRKFDLIGWSSSTAHIPSQKSTYESCHASFSGLEYWRSAPEEFFKLTEIYEHGLRLRGDESHRSLSVHLLPYKYIMCFRKLGQQVRVAYEYCRSIGEVLGYVGVDWLRSESINFTMVRNMRDLGQRLHSLLSLNGDAPPDDGKWLLNIDLVYGLFCDKLGLWNPKRPPPDFTHENNISREENDYTPVSHQIPPQRNSREENDFTPVSHMYQRPPQHNGCEDIDFRPRLNHQRLSQTQTKPTYYEENVVQPQMSHQKQYKPQNNQSYYEEDTTPAPMTNQRPLHTHNNRPPAEDNQSRQAILPPRSSQPPPNAMPMADHSRAPTQNMAPTPLQISRLQEIAPPSALPTEAISTAPPPRSMQSPMFVPSSASVAGSDVADCFTTVGNYGHSRSRSQSNGSVASENHKHVAPQENHRKVPPPAAAAPPKEAPSSSKPAMATVQKDSASTNSDEKAKQSGWSLIDYLKPKSKGVFLPDDSTKSIEFDPVRNIWVDKSNPDSDRPPTPPPMMPMAVSTLSSPAANANSPLSKYRLATPRVKPSMNISPALPQLPTVPAYPDMNGIGPYGNQGGERQSTFKYSQEASGNHSSQNQIGNQ